MDEDVLTVTDSDRTIDSTQICNKYMCIIFNKVLTIQNQYNQMYRSVLLPDQVCFI